jgi:hypothetical protein
MLKRKTACQTPILILAVVAAWALSLQPYIRIADDWPLGVHDTISGMEANGFWRILHFYLHERILSLPDSVIPWVILLQHVGCTCALYQLAQQLGIDLRTAFLGALFFGVIPIANGALLWQSGSLIIITTGLSLVVWMLAIRSSKTPSPALTAVLVVAVLLTNLIQENLVFLLPLLGITAILWDHLLSKARLRSGFATVFAPVLGTVLYVTLMALFRGDAPTKTIAPYPRGLISPLLNQLSAWYCFEPAFSPAPWKWLADSAPHWPIALLEASALGSLFLIKRNSHESGYSSDAPMRHLWRKLMLLVVLALGTSAVYALAGGYSMDTRKRYPFVVLGVLGALTVIQSSPLLSRPITRCWKYIAIALLLTGITSTSLCITAWRWHATREAQLVDFIIHNDLKGDWLVAKESESLSTLLPRFSCSPGPGLGDESVYLALKYRAGREGIEFRSGRDGLLLYQNGHWSARPAVPSGAHPH